MIDHLWLQLLQLKKRLDSFGSPVLFCHITTQKDVSINDPLSFETTVPSVLIHWNKKQALETPPTIYTEILVTANQFPVVLQQGNMSQETIDFLLLYLPYCFLGITANEQKKTQVVAHFAQTLDGKIATTTGVSKWIGNQENLIHAHRMRALCDSVLVGKGTLRMDDPQLTVRHVNGDNPIRIILGKAFEEFESRMNPKDGEIWVIGKSCCRLPKGFTFIPIEAYNESISETELLKKLFSLGVKTTYLEGGPATTSRFLKSGNINILQLHLAPIIFGSGISAIELPRINQLEESVHFSTFKFTPIGNAIMFTGYL